MAKGRKTIYTPQQAFLDLLKVRTALEVAALQPPGALSADKLKELASTQERAMNLLQYTMLRALRVLEEGAQDSPSEGA